MPASPAARPGKASPGGQDPTAASERINRGTPWLRAFWRRAYSENVTGLSAMVAYNLMLAVFPFVLLVLFVFSQVLRIKGVETGILNDLQRLFPNTEQDTLQHGHRPDPRQLGHLRDPRRARLAVDRRLLLGRDGHRLLPHLPRRLPRLGRAEALLLRDADRRRRLPRRQRRPAGGRGRRDQLDADKLPFGLSNLQGLDTVLLIGGALLITFLICCVIYWAVPKGHMPWRAVWPGALFVTIATGIANWLFPIYLTNISSLTASAPPSASS